MKNTPNYIVPMRTNRSDAANPLFLNGSGSGLRDVIKDQDLMFFLRSLYFVSEVMYTEKASCLFRKKGLCFFLCLQFVF